MVTHVARDVPPVRKTRYPHPQLPRKITDKTIVLRPTLPVASAARSLVEMRRNSNESGACDGCLEPFSTNCTYREREEKFSRMPKLQPRIKRFVLYYEDEASSGKEIDGTEANNNNTWYAKMFEGLLFISREHSLVRGKIERDHGILHCNGVRMTVELLLHCPQFCKMQVVKLPTGSWLTGIRVIKDGEETLMEEVKLQWEKQELMRLAGCLNHY
ncbi:hypothetical protein Trydic_g13996 [Trypoxylus dichotomus]